jgi:rhodanese-related sulfurtransferase
MSRNTWGAAVRLRDISVFLSAFVLVAALLLARNVMAVEPGPVTPEQGKAMVQEKKDLVILDVRNPSEYVVVHYPNALNIPVNELEKRISEVPAGKPVLVHCALGKRAKRGYDLLKEKRPDIKELYVIDGQVIFP